MGGTRGVREGGPFVKFEVFFPSCVGLGDYQASGPFNINYHFLLNKNTGKRISVPFQCISH